MENRIRQLDPAEPVRPLLITRWATRAFVYLAVTLLIPLDHYLHGLSWSQAISVHIGGYVIAALAIELAFGYVFKVRKRTGYPQIVLVEMGGSPSLSGAATNALEATVALLRVDAAFIALKNARSTLNVVATSRLRTRDARALLEALEPLVSACQESLQPVWTPVPEGVDGPDARPRRAALVPIFAFDQPLGVMVLCGRASPDIKDAQILRNLGATIGLSLHHLRQKADLRESQERLHTVVTGAPIAFLATDSEGVFTLAEGSILESIGLPAASLVGVSFRDAFSADPGLQAAFQRALDGDETVSTTHVGGRCFGMRLSPERDESGDVRELYCVAWDVSEREKAERAIKESEARFRALIENASDFIVIVEPSGLIKYASPATTRGLGFSAHDLIGRSVFELFHPDDIPELGETFVRRLETRGVGVPIEFRARHADGSWRWIEAIGNFDLIDDPAIGGAIINARDITERKEAFAALRESEARFRSLFQAAGDVIYTLSLDGILTSLNPAFETVTGWPVDQWVGKSFAPLLHPDDVPLALDAMRRMAQRDATLPTSFEWRILKANGQYMTGEFVPRPLLENGQLVGVLGIVRDVTARRRVEDTIRYFAQHDALTGLANRNSLEEHLDTILAAAAQTGQQVAVVFADLDRFKLVNDTLGHAGGDKLLQEVAAELRAMVREGDFVARFGGDEFVLLFPVNETAQAKDIAERIRLMLERPRALMGKEIRVTASIGVAVYPADGDNGQVLLRCADSAMYRAKELGRDNCQFYSPDMSSGSAERLTLQTDLRQALDQDRFRLVYQPIVDVASGDIVGAEALLRWQHPQRGFLRPDDFIPLAEDTGLIHVVGDWAMRTAVTQAVSWQAAGLPRIRVAVNLSARQLQPGIVEAVRDCIASTGIDPALLQLEVTESCMVLPGNGVLDVLAELRSLGVSIAIDDFGTGYSSLSYLKRSPFDAVKIDRSFVRDLASDPNDAAIARGIISMARRLKLKVIAEGVETQRQLDLLKQWRCDEFQGYLFSKPVPPETIEELLVRQRSKASTAPAVTGR